MWNLSLEAEYEKRARKWPKKHQREFVATHNNLDTFFNTLNSGASVEQARFGFVHPEPHGIVAIDQKGGGTGLKETRLYVYPDRTSNVLYLITIGDKKTQKSDIRYASEFVTSLLQHTSESHGE